MGGVITLFILLLTILFYVSLLVNSVIAVNPSGFSMKMFHRDSKESPLYPGDHLTQDERFQRLVKQSKDRARYIARKMLSLRNSINPDVARLPMTYENVGSSYVALVGLGTFGGSTTYMSYFLMVDTGSDIIWIQCQGAYSSFPQRDPLYPATHSGTYTPLTCIVPSGGRTINNPLCYPGLCNNQGLCIYQITYEDGAVTSGILAIEKFTVSTDTHGVQSFPILMGCGLHQVNFDSDGLPEFGAGVLGLNGQPKSFLRQLNLGKFEYCLRPHTDGMDGTPTYLRFGTDTILDRGVRQPYKTHLYEYGKGNYFLVLEDISVNGSRVGFEREDFDYDDFTGNGGCLIDSGTTLTMMQESHLNKLANKVKEHFRNFQLDPIIPSPVEGLEFCFPKNRERFEFPKITFHFQDADFELKKDEPDTSFWITDNYVCLGIVGVPADDTPFDVMFGAMQQARKRILYDVAGESLYFAEEDCRQDNMQSI
ncbi:aspartic proteinase CDR1-like [Papaver somniferum]|uniref:aspartic proteinase CDR1-like n=1 Tax=Papaver somniferum TaxID=3469 RepID=UPI000E701289|nr:aspartic proteinase CDR1-like [Papaver somniferum]